MADKKSGYEEGRIEGVMFVYTAIQQPKKKFESEATEWSVNVFLSKDQAAEIKAKFPRKGDAKVTPTDEFKEKFGIEPLYPEEALQYSYRLSRNTTYATGEEVPKEKAPRVILRGPNGVNYNITDKVLVGNGSKGDIVYYVSDTKMGRFPKLKDIIVTDLVKYERPAFMEVQEASDEDLAELLGGGFTSEVKTATAATKASADPVAKATGGAVSEENADMDMPW